MAIFKNMRVMLLDYHIIRGLKDSWSDRVVLVRTVAIVGE